MRCYLLLLVFAVLNDTATLAQTKKGEALMQPTTWDRVRYAHSDDRYYEGPDAEVAGTNQYWKFRSSSDRTESRWWVFTTHAGVRLAPTRGGEQTGTALEMSHRFFVFEENGEWLRVGSDARNPPEGWCHKRDLILWYQPLVEPKTKIELKAFMVNTTTSASELKQGKEQYQLYDGPGATATKLGEDLLYDVLFVYGYSAENEGRYLVSAYAELGPKSPLLGWVSKKRVKVWTTRLCLEPNDDAKAVELRRREQVYAKLFKLADKKKLEDYLSTGKGRGIVDRQERDPAMGDGVRLRMDPRLFRYPVFQSQWVGDKKDNCIFTTGVSGINSVSSTGLLEGLGETQVHDFQGQIAQWEKDASLVNIVFVVEGSSDSKDMFDLAKASINAIKAKVGAGRKLRYGAVVYRNDKVGDDTLANPEIQYLEKLELTTSAERATQWIGTRLPVNAGDGGNGRCAYLGLKTALGLVPEKETNVIVHLSRRPDNTRDNGMYAENDKAKSLVKPDELCAPLAKAQTTHYLGFVLMGAGEDARIDAFEGMQGDVLNNFANKLNNRYKGIAEFAKDNSGRAEAAVAVTTKEPGMEVVRMDRTPFVLKAHLLSSVPALTGLQQMITNEVGECMDASTQLHTDMLKVLKGNSQISDRASDFTDDMIAEMELGGADPEKFREYIASERVHLFEDARTYYRTYAPTMKEPLFKYVLFYSADDLRHEISMLQSLVESFDMGTEETKKNLEVWWKQRAKEVMGNEYNEDVKPTVVRERLLGIHEMDMVRPFEEVHVLKGLTLEDLGDNSKFTFSLMTKYAEQVKHRLGELQEIQTKGDFYQAAGDLSGTRKFYWVPIELVFN